MSAATQHTDDNIFANANAIGQSWFAASGDSGSKDCSGLVTVDNPANSPHVIGVGGTTPTCSAGMSSGSPARAGYGSEVAWASSGGGVSQLFTRPAFQTGDAETRCRVPAGTMRLVPDVALEADTSPGNYVVENGLWYIVGGTSDAAPQWAGFFAGLDQQRGGAGLGNPGALLYGLCGTSAFHDVTSGSNGDYSAGVGYDLVTGLGSFDAANLLAAAGGATTTTTAAPPTTTSSTSSSVTTTTSTSSSTTRTSTTSTSMTTSTTSTTLPATANLVRNGGFESGQSSWSDWTRDESVVSDVRFTGKNALRFFDSSAFTRSIYQDMPVTGGGAYTISADVLTSSIDQGQEAHMLAEWRTASGSVIRRDVVNVVRLASIWTLQSTPVTAPATARTLRLYLQLTPSASNDGAAWFDEVRVAH